MKVLLLQDVLGTGRKGEVREVSDGYARNFLLPRQVAKIATAAVLGDVARQVVKQKKQSEHELKTFQKIASQLDGREVVIAEKVSEGGTLYAAVKPMTIADAIQKQLKLTVLPRQVIVDTPLKELGEHQVRIEFSHGLEAEINVIVSEA